MAALWNTAVYHEVKYMAKGTATRPSAVIAGAGAVGAGLVAA